MHFKINLPYIFSGEALMRSIPKFRYLVNNCFIKKNLFKLWIAVIRFIVGIPILFWIVMNLISNTNKFDWQLSGLISLCVIVSDWWILFNLILTPFLQGCCHSSHCVTSHWVCTCNIVTSSHSMTSCTMTWMQGSHDYCIVIITTWRWP